MADLGTIGIAIEVRGREALRQIENDMTAVDRSSKSALRSFEAFERAGLKTAETFRYVSEAAKKRLTDEERITRELIKQRDAAEKLAKANAEAFQSQIGGNLGLGARGVSASASASAMEAEIERLRQKYDQIYASSQLYERSLQELNRAHMLGVTSTKQHEAAVESLNAEYQAFQNGAAMAGNRFAQHVNQSASGMNQFGVVIQQAGYQVGDFLVQIQSGTNWMVAFGQQATQLVGVLPLMGAGFMGLSSGALVALSAGLGIAIPLVTALGAMWMRTTEDTVEGANRQQQAVEALTNSLIEQRLERQMLASSAQSTSEQEILNEINSLRDERNTLEAEYQTLVTLTADSTSLRDAAERGALATQLEANRLRLQDLDSLINQIEYERQLEIAQRRRANELRNAYREAKVSADSLYDRLVSITQIDLASVFTRASGPLNNLLQGASALLTRMSALAYVNSNQQGGTSYLANQYALYGQGRVAGEQAAREAGSLYTPFPVPEVNIGSGGPSKRETMLRKEIDLVNELTQVEKDRQTVLQSIEGSLESGFMAMVEGTKSVKDAFKSMAYEIIKELYRVLVVQRLVGGISGAIGMFAGPSTGSLGLPFGRASGGSIMPNQPYLVGEHGPELVIPRHSGTVVNANQTAGAMGGSGTTVVNNNISVTGSDAAMVRAEVAKMIPQITNATKAAVIDAKQRGGQMAAAFR